MPVMLGFPRSRMYKPDLRLPPRHSPCRRVSRAQQQQGGTLPQSRSNSAESPCSASNLYRVI